MLATGAGIAYANIDTAEGGSRVLNPVFDLINI